MKLYSSNDRESWLIGSWEAFMPKHTKILIMFKVTSEILAWFDAFIRFMPDVKGLAR